MTRDFELEERIGIEVVPWVTMGGYCICRKRDPRYPIRISTFTNGEWYVDWERGFCTSVEYARVYSAMLTYAVTLVEQLRGL